MEGRQRPVRGTRNSRSATYVVLARQVVTAVACAGTVQSACRQLRAVRLGQEPAGRVRTRHSSAREIFDEIGTVAFADRPARELAATGKTIRSWPDDGGPGNALSVREQQIGRLAADGLPNREIGEHLFISHRRLRPRAGGHQVGRCQQAQLHNALETGRPQVRPAGRSTRPTRIPSLVRTRSGATT